MQRIDPLSIAGGNAWVVVRCGLAFAVVLSTILACAAEESRSFATANRYVGDARCQRCLDESGASNLAWAACGEELIAREDERLNQA